MAMFSEQKSLLQYTHLDFQTFQIRFKSDLLSLDFKNQISRITIERINTLLSILLESEDVGVVEYIAFLFHYIKFQDVDFRIRQRLIEKYELVQYDPKVEIELTSSTPEMKTISMCDKAEEYFEAVIDSLCRESKENTIPNFAEVGFFLKADNGAPEFELFGKRFSIISFIPTQSLLLSNGHVLFRNISYINRNQILVDLLRKNYPLMFINLNLDRILTHLQNWKELENINLNSLESLIDSIVAFVRSLDETHAKMISCDSYLIYSTCEDIRKNIADNKLESIIYNILKLLQVLELIRVNDIPDYLAKNGIIHGFKNMYYLNPGSITTKWHMARLLNLRDIDTSFSIKEI